MSCKQYLANAEKRNVIDFRSQPRIWRGYIATTNAFSHTTNDHYLKNQRLARISDDARKPLPIYQSSRRYFEPSVAQRISYGWKM
jgi:hypothetical protein